VEKDGNVLEGGGGGGVARDRVLVEKDGNVLGDMGFLSKAKVGVGVETKTYWLAIPSL
jgi:hypothetical protein